MAFVSVNVVGRVNGAVAGRDAVSARASQRAAFVNRRRAVVLCAEEATPAAAPEDKPEAAAEAAEPVAEATPEAVAAEEPAAAKAEEAPTETASAAPGPESKKMSLDEIVAGNEYKGVIKTTTTYGAFVDIGAPTDGLLHVSQLADHFVKDVTDVVKQGDEVTVRVLTVDPKKKEFSLSMKSESGGGSSDGGKREGRPSWSAFKFDAEKFVEGTVVSTATYGAFINVGGPTDGMCHISEMSDERTDNVADVMKVGDKVQVRITSADNKRNRISLSLKKWTPNAKDTLKADMEAAEEFQPDFKTSMELAFEKAKANTSG